MCSLFQLLLQDPYRTCFLRVTNTRVEVIGFRLDRIRTFLVVFVFRGNDFLMERIKIRFRRLRVETLTTVVSVEVWVSM